MTIEVALCRSENGVWLIKVVAQNNSISLILAAWEEEIGNRNFDHVGRASLQAIWD